MEVMLKIEKGRDRGQFYQPFMLSFYASRSQKCKKDSQVKYLFDILGSVRIKAARKYVDAIDLWGVHKCELSIFDRFLLLITCYENIRSHNKHMLPPPPKHSHTHIHSPKILIF